MPDYEDLRSLDPAKAAAAAKRALAWLDQTPAAFDAGSTSHASSLSTPPNAAYGRTGSTGDANAFSGWTSNMMLTTRIHTPSSGSTIDCRFSSLA